MSDLAGDMLQNNNKNMEKSFLDKILIQYDSLGKETKNKIHLLTQKQENSKKTNKHGIIQKE